MKELILDAKVAFASITKPEGHSDGKHMVGVYVDKKFKKDFLKKGEEFWENEKNSKDTKQDHGPSEWFSEDEDDSSKIIFWATAKAETDYPITLKNGPGCSFKLSDFSKIGKGSIIDLSVSVYYYVYKGKPGLGRGINAVSLKKLVAYEGDDGLDGDVVVADDVAPIDKPEKKKKSKKKKKKDA
jgi:hypothetical protein